MNLSPQSLIEWASHWVPEENRTRFAEALANELTHWTAPQAIDKCGDGGKLTEILAEYDAVIASIPPELMAKDGDEADFVIRVCDYKALRSAVLSQDSADDRPVKLAQALAKWAKKWPRDSIMPQTMRHACEGELAVLEALAQNIVDDANPVLAQGTGNER